MKDKKNFIKGMAAALMAAVMVSAMNPVPVMAAGKMTVSVTKPKKNVKTSKNKITIHTKNAVQLKVKYAGKDVTKKATYKVNNTKAARVKSGKITARKNGKTVLTVKYKGNTKKYNLIVSANHNWKAHKATTTVTRYETICSCGVNLDDLCEEKFCEKCYKDGLGDNYCACKDTEHRLNHIRNGELYSYSEKPVYKKVTYTDYYTCECGAKKAGEPKPQ